MELFPGIHSTVIGAPQPGVFPPNVFIVVGQRGTAFIDTGYNRPEETQVRLDYLSTIGNPKVNAIVITHRHMDHMGGASQIHRATGAPIICHSMEREAINKGLDNLSVHRAVEDKERLDLGGLTLEFVHAPGHTMGSLCVYVPERKIVFAGDNILGVGTTVILPEDGDMASYISSMRKLLTFELEAICPGHGPVVHQPKAKLQELVQHRLEREEQILSLLHKGQRTLEELFNNIYPELAPRLHQMAKSQIRSHIIKLEREGKVSTVAELTYALKG